MNNNSFQEENEIRRLKEKIGKYISGNQPREILQQQLRKYIYSQLELFTNNAKENLTKVLDIPHTLKNLLYDKVEIPEYEIDQLQDKFKSLRSIAKDIKLPEVEESFSLLQILKQQRDYYQNRFADINFTFHYDESEAYRMVGEKESFKLIFRNLIKNSVKSIKEKLGNKSSFDPNIIVHLSKNDRDKQYEIRFTDNGVGVEPGTKIVHLMEKQAKGSGLGLPAISHIIREYKGSIIIESAQTGKNSGLTFLITIPSPNEL